MDSLLICFAALSDIDFARGGKGDDSHQHYEDYHYEHHPEVGNTAWWQFYLKQFFLHLLGGARRSRDSLLESRMCRLCRHVGDTPWGTIGWPGLGAHPVGGGQPVVVWSLRGGCLCVGGGPP